MGATGALVASALVAGAVAEAASGGSGPAAGHGAPAVPVNALQGQFASAAREFHVPQSVLMALGYEESLWDTHQGAPSTTGNYNVMGLTKVDPSDLATPSGNASDAGSDGAGDGKKRPVRTARLSPSVAALTAVNTASPELHTLDTAAKLIGRPASALKTDSAQSIRGGAALLASYEQKLKGSLPADPGQWYTAVAQYARSGDAAAAKQFADRVFHSIRTGLRVTTAEGQAVTLTADPSLRVATTSSGTLAAQGIAPRTAVLAPAATPAATPPVECPPSLLSVCTFTAALYSQRSSDVTDYGSYGLSNRAPGDGTITSIVIHDTESTTASAINTFQSTGNYASAHYIVSRDGSVTQMVPTADMAWHSNNKTFNTHSIGVEHEGWALPTSTWYTPAEYQSSATLVKYLAGRFGVPLDRQHIIGHDEVPGINDDYLVGSPTKKINGQHWDPGPYWDWSYYLNLLGAPLSGNGDVVVGGTVTIAPPYATSYQPTITGCGTSGTDVCPAHPANFVYLYNGPSTGSGLITDPVSTKYGRPTGNQLAWDWTDRAAYGETFVVAAVQGDWTAIWFGGQAQQGRKAWFYNPGGAYAYANAPAGAKLVTPTGSTPIKVYGRAYPEDAVNPGVAENPTNALTPLSYTIQPGESYLALGGSVLGDFYESNTYYADYPTCVSKGGCKYYTGSLRYYPISFNHRVAYVLTSDVQLISPTAPPKSSFYAVTPTRVFDTRDGTGTGGVKAPIGANTALSLQVGGLNAGGTTIPSSGLTAVVLSVTAVNPTASSYVSVYGDQNGPGSVNLIFGPNQIVSNLVTAPVVNGKVDFFNRTGTVNVAAVITGYYATGATGGSTFSGIAPTHLLDTRNGTGLTGGAAPIGPGGIDTVTVTGGTTGVPADGTVTAVALNITAISGTANSFVALYPGNSALASSTSMSFAPGQIVANTMIVPVDSSGTIKFYNRAGSVNVTADVTGYFGTSGSGASYVPLITRHALDTRLGLGASGALGAGATLALPVTGVGAVPKNATGVVMNVTVIGPTANSYVSIYPDGAKTGASTGLDFAAGQSLSNMVVVPVVNGKVDFYNHSGSVNVLADVLGFYAP